MSTIPASRVRAVGLAALGRGAKSGAGPRVGGRCRVEVVVDRMAGLDVGKEPVTVCVRTPHQGHLADQFARLQAQRGSTKRAAVPSPTRSWSRRAGCGCATQPYRDLGPTRSDSPSGQTHPSGCQWPPLLPWCTCTARRCRGAREAGPNYTSLISRTGAPGSPDHAIGRSRGGLTRKFHLATPSGNRWRWC